SKDGQCGKDHGVCPNSECCSKYGWCGSTDEYCGAGCQSEFGTCGNDKTSKAPTDSTNKKPNNSGSFKFYEQCNNNKHWALTFDDGPYKYDEDLLDLLKKYNVKATFFLNGDNVMDIYSTQGKRIVKRMAAEGHIVASHTWSHADLDELNASQIKEEMIKVEEAIVKITGKRPAFMRLPYGSGTSNPTVKKTLQSLGYTAGFQWNVDTMDWDNKGEDLDYVIKKFKAKFGKGIISLNHTFYSGNMNKKTFLNLIEEEIKLMKKNGYTPVTADVCVG
ncbi:glycoside hydrolase/deacetylase, partial [Anaeromyces robustus]